MTVTIGRHNLYTSLCTVLVTMHGLGCCAFTSVIVNTVEVAIRISITASVVSTMTLAVDAQQSRPCMVTNDV